MEKKTLTENEKVLYKDENIEFSYPEEWKEFDRAKWEILSTIMSVSLPSSTPGRPVVFSLLVYSKAINKDDFEKTVETILDRVKNKLSERSGITDLEFSLEKLSPDKAIIRTSGGWGSPYVGESHFFITSQGRIYDFEFTGLVRSDKEEGANKDWLPYFDEIINSIKIY
jgi:hypothetical protein